MACKIFLTAGCKKCLPGHVKNCLPWSEKTPYHVVANLPYHAQNGVTRLIWAYGDSIKDDVFKEKLGEVSIKELSRTAKERRAGSLGYAEAMLNYYNKRMKAPLKWSMLYSNKTASGRKNAGIEEKTETDWNAPVNEKENVEQDLATVDKVCASSLSPETS